MKAAIILSMLVVLCSCATRNSDPLQGAVNWYGNKQVQK